METLYHHSPVPLIAGFVSILSGHEIRTSTLTPALVMIALLVLSTSRIITLTTTPAQTLLHWTPVFSALKMQSSSHAGQYGGASHDREL